MLQSLREWKKREKQKCVCNIGANRQVVAVIWGRALIQLETVVGSSSDAQWVITDGAMPCNKWTLFGDSVWQWWLCQQSSVHSDNNNKDQHIGSKTRGTSQTELNWSVVVMHVVVVQYTNSYLGCGAFLLLLQFSSTLFLFHTLFFLFLLFFLFQLNIRSTFFSRNAASYGQVKAKQSVVQSKSNKLQ